MQELTTITVSREVKVIKKDDLPKPDPKRSELSLLEILIRRNEEKAREFLARLK